jgi:hypothetical protein
MPWPSTATWPTREMKARRWLLVAAALLLLALALGLAIGYFKARAPRPEGCSYAVAAAYLAAVRRGDVEGALRLYRGDPLCSTVYEYVRQEVDEHVALLRAAQVRDVIFAVEPAEGVSYTPGSETAEISFQVQQGVAWRAATIWLVMGPPADGIRYICYLGHWVDTG